MLQLFIIIGISSDLVILNYLRLFISNDPSVIWLDKGFLLLFLCLSRLDWHEMLHIWVSGLVNFVLQVLTSSNFSLGKLRFDSESCLLLELDRLWGCPYFKRLLIDLLLFHWLFTFFDFLLSVWGESSLCELAPFFCEMNICLVEVSLSCLGSFNLLFLNLGLDKSFLNKSAWSIGMLLGKFSLGFTEFLDLILDYSVVHIVEFLLGCLVNSEVFHSLVFSSLELLLDLLLA